MKRLIILLPLFSALISCYCQTTYTIDANGNYHIMDTGGNVIQIQSRMEFIGDSLKIDLKRRQDAAWEKELQRVDAERKEKSDADYKRRKENEEILRLNDSIERAEEREREQQLIKDSLEDIRQRKIQIKQNQEWEVRQKVAKEEAAKKKQAHYEELIKTYGQAIAAKMNNRQVVIGWTKSMCIESWGKSYSVNKTTTANGVREQWVYSLKRYLYFDGNVLTAIQE